MWVMCDMKKTLKNIWSFLEVIIIIYVIVVTMFVLFKNKYGYTEIGNRTYINIDDTLKDNITNTHKGDLLIVGREGNYKNGQIVYYYTVSNDEYIVKSGTIKSSSTNSYSITDGKSDVIVNSNRVIGNASRIVSSIGGVLITLESRGGFLLLVLLPIVIVFVYQLCDFIIVLRHDNDDDTDNKNNKDDNNIEVL